MVKLIGWINNVHDADLGDIAQLVSQATVPGRQNGLLNTPEHPCLAPVGPHGAAVVVWEGGTPAEAAEQLAKELAGTSAGV